MSIHVHLKVNKMVRNYIKGSGKTGMTQEEYIKSSLHPCRNQLGKKRPNAFLKIAGDKHPMKNPEIVKKMVETKKRNGDYINSSKIMKNLNKNQDIVNKRTNTKVRNGDYKKLSEKLKYIKRNPEIIKRIIETNKMNGSYKKSSERMKQNNPAKYCKSPSKPQLELFKQKQLEYGEDKVFLNHPVSKDNGGYYYLDVAIPSLMLDFEYDNEFWHNLQEVRIPDYHKIRDEYLQSLGWNVTRIKNCENIKEMQNV